MTITVGLFDITYQRLEKRIKGIDPKIEYLKFDKSGNFRTEATITPPTEIELDYLWLSPDLTVGNLGSLPFDVALACKRIDVLQTFNAGLDNSAYKKLSNRGVRICNSSAQSIAISEYILVHALSLIHPIDKQRSLQTQKEWSRTPFREISNTNWLIIGFGSIGMATATRVKAFGATVSVVRRSPQTSEIIDHSGTMKDLQSYLPSADVIVLACSLNDDTRKLADTEFFQSIKKGAILINVARGALIDDTAMIAALNRGQLSAAVLDVFNPEPLPITNQLWVHPKVRVSAHTSFNGDGTPSRWDKLFFENLPRYVRGEVLLHEVNPNDIS